MNTTLDLLYQKQKQNMEELEKKKAEAFNKIVGQLQTWNCSESENHPKAQEVYDWVLDEARELVPEFFERKK